MGSHRRRPARSVDPALLSWRVDDGKPEREVLSERDSAMLFTSRLLERDGERVRPACVLTHFGELLLACDSRCRAEAGAADLVLGVNRTTQLLCNMLRSGGKALDLGTGCGTLALAAASIAVSVIGTDINQRALDFGRINAALNGVGNVSFLQGDRFEPVAGRRFDSIICNPPFFLAPVSGLLYCENGMELDRFVESLASERSAISGRGRCVSNAL